MASPSSSDHSSPSSASNPDDGRIPQGGYAAQYAPFVGKQTVTGKVGVVGDESFPSHYHPQHAQPSSFLPYPAPLQDFAAAPRSLTSTSSAPSRPTQPTQAQQPSNQPGQVRMDEKSGKQVVDIGTGVLKNLPLLITGVPLVGAKSRVETQIKIRIALALPTQASSSSTPYPNPNGQQDESQLAFVSTYSHVKLQKGTATKRKSRKSVAAEGGAGGEPRDEEMLWLETEVYCATEGNGEDDMDDGEGAKSEQGERPKGLRVFACAGCRTREVKRAQRKLAARIRPTLSDSDLDTPYPDENGGGPSQDERHKIVLFNCGALLDFSTGECTLPARVTCYCRHHREKTGFLLKFLLKDHLGNVVASGFTPPIMITDDHKTSGKAAAVEPAVAALIPKSLIMPSNPPPAPAAVAGAPPATKGRRRATKKRESSTSGEEDRKRTSVASGPKPYDRKVSPTSTSSSVTHTPRTLSMTPMSMSMSVPPSPASKNGGAHLSPMTPVSYTPHGSTTFNQIQLPTTIQENSSNGVSQDSTPNVLLTPSIPGYVGPSMSLGLHGTSPANGHLSPSIASGSYNPQDLVSHLVEHAEREREGAMTMDESMDGGSGGEGGAGGFTPPESMLTSSSTSRRTSDSEGGPAEYLETNPFDLQMDDQTLSFDALLDYDGTNLQQHQHQQSQQDMQANDAFPELSSYSHSSLPPTSSADPISFESLFSFPASPPSSIPSPTLYNGLQPARHQQFDQQQQHQQQQAQQHHHHHQRDQAPTSSASSANSDLLLSNVQWPALQAPVFPLGAATTPRPSYNAPTPSPPPPPKPVITRLIPGEGPMHGGIEVTILGANFVPGLTCVFGDSPATNTQMWSDNTIVCVLPPSACPGPVVVSFKTQQGAHNSPTGGLQLFTYLDTSDRALMELALQVVGLKMTGRIEDAKNVALRIVGQNPAADGASPQSNGNSSGGSNGYQQNALSRDAYHSPSQSRRGSIDASAASAALWGAGSRGGNFQDTIINFLGLVEIEDVPGAAPSTPRLARAISLKNKQGQTLLHLAVMLGFHRLVSHLISLGADLDARDKNGYTSLALAALCGRVACSRLLLDASADQDIVTADGKTPFDVAREKDQVDVESLLARQSDLRRDSTWVVDSGISLGSSGEDSIDADNPSTDDESDDGHVHQIQLTRSASMPRVSVQTVEDDEDEEVLPLRWSVSTETGGRSRSSTYLRRRASIDSQRTEGTIYAAQVLGGGDADSYLSDGGSIRHFPAGHHNELLHSPLSHSMDRKKNSALSESALLPSSPENEKAPTSPDGSKFVESWLRRTLSATVPQKFPFPHLPSVSDIPTLAFPTSMTPTFPSLPAQLNFSHSQWPSQLNPWSTNEKTPLVHDEKGDHQHAQPTWAQYVAAYPYLPLALSQWLKENAPSMPPLFQSPPSSPGSELKKVRAEGGVVVPADVLAGSRRASPVASSSRLPMLMEQQGGKASVAAPQVVSKPSRAARPVYTETSELVDREVYTQHVAVKRRKVKQDRMLVFFWAPVLALVLAYTLITHLPLIFHTARRAGGRLLPFRGLLN